MSDNLPHIANKCVGAKGTIFAGCAAAAPWVRLLPPVSPGWRTRRLLALALRDLRRVAAVGAALSVPLLMRWKLQTAAALDLTPSMHWPEPIVSSQFNSDRGPVMVTVEYRIKPSDRDAFLAALAKLAKERRRDGAFDWSAFEDVAQEGRFVETFLLDSWLEHLRQHERVSQADRELQEIVHGFHLDGTPRVTHLIAVRSH